MGCNDEKSSNCVLDYDSRAEERAKKPLLSKVRRGTKKEGGREGARETLTVEAGEEREESRARAGEEGRKEGVKPNCYRGER